MSDYRAGVGTNRSCFTPLSLVEAGLLIGTPLAIIGVCVLVGAGSTPAPIFGGALLLSGVMQVSVALLIRGLRRQ